MSKIHESNNDAVRRRDRRLVQPDFSFVAESDPVEIAWELGQTMDLMSCAGYTTNRATKLADKIASIEGLPPLSECNTNQLKTLRTAIRHELLCGGG